MSKLLSVPLSKITRRRASVRPWAFVKTSPIFGDIGFLAADNKPATRPDLRLQLEWARLPDAALDLLLHLLKQRLEAIEVLAFLAIGDFLGGALLGAGADMAKFGDVGRTRRALQFGKQLVLVHRLHRRGGSGRRSSQQSLMIERRKKRTAFLKRAQPVEAHGIEPLEDVALFAVLRGAAVLSRQTAEFPRSRR